MNILASILWFSYQFFLPIYNNNDNMEDSVDTSIQRLKDYTKKSKEWPETTLIAHSSTEPKWEEKQLYGYFKRQTRAKFHTKSILIAAPNNAIRTNYVKAKIDKTQQNSKCRLWGDRDETINHVIRESSKLALKEYKTRFDLVGKVIHRELSKKFIFDHTRKWHMDKRIT